jgi:enoyl-CoA hydratase
MSYHTLAFEKKEGVGCVTLRDSGNKQILASRLIDELTELCEEVSWDETIRVVMISGTGNNPFTIASPSPEEKENGRSLADPVSRLAQPVIVALNGDVFGWGLELAMACDIRVAGEGSRFGLPEVQSGAIPSDGGTQRLPRIVGKGKAMEMILTGEPIDSREALRIGLVSKVVSQDQLMAASARLAEEMASKAPLALQYVKEAVYAGMELTLEQGLKMEADLYLLLHTTADREKGIRAFREKKVPAFEGK